MKVLEFNDFTGGLYDKNLPGVHNTYSKADNCLIEADKNLISRDGFDILSSTGYLLTTSERAARLINFDNNSELLAIHNKKLDYISAGAWATLLGPVTSHQAFPNNAASSLIETAQWNHHLFLASNNGIDPVLKYYRDGSNNPQLRTAGLPKPATAKIYPDAASKLAAAITLAVDIKTQMQAHVNDFGVSPAAHIAKDLAVYNALNALVTPVTLADVIAYTKVLRAQYSAHLVDAKKSLTNQVYHIQLSDIGTDYPAFGNGIINDPILNLDIELSLPSDANLDTIDEAIRVLNDVRNKYTWHALAPVTHGNATFASAPTWGAHFVTTPEINKFYGSDGAGDIVTPKIQPDYSTFLKYVNYLKAEYVAHIYSAQGISNSFSHISQDIGASGTEPYIADATDLCTAVAVLGNLYYSYGQHISKANLIFDPTVTNRGYYSATTQINAIFQAVITAGSATITSVTPNPSTFPLSANWKIIKYSLDVTAPYTAWFHDLFSTQIFSPAAKVSSTTATTIVMDSVALPATSGSYSIAFHWNGIHPDAERTPAAQATSFSQSKLFKQTYDPLLENLTALGLLASTFANQLKAHETSGATVITDSAINSGGVSTLYQFKDGYTYYNISPNSGTSEYLSPHGVAISLTAYTLTNLLVFPSTSLTTLAGVLQFDGQGYFEAGLNTTTYLYRYTYIYDYTVGSTSFRDESSPSDVILVNSFVSTADFTSGDTTWRDPISISSIPVLTNTASQNYDTTNIDVLFYRTIGDGTVYFLSKTLDNGTTSFSDYLDDTNLLNAATLYTNGGQKDNGAPPIAKYIHILENIMYYANGRTLYQSMPDDPDSVNASFTDTFEEDITGISSTRANLLVFSATSVYRIEGQFDTLGQGFMRHEKIFEQTGCVAPQSIVKTEIGVFFFGIDGIYYTDGFQAFRAVINHDTFKAYVSAAAQKSAIQGVYNPAEKKIYWTVETTSSFTSPNIMVVLDLHFGIKPDGTPNTQYSGGFDGYTGFNPTALTVYNNILHYGDKDGYVFKQTVDLAMDLKKDTSIAATLWNKRTILWDFKTNHEDFGSPNFRKYFARLNVEFEQITNLSVQITSDADKGRIISNLPIIRSRKLLDWGDPKIDWTSSVYTAKDGGVIDEFRRFLADGSLRSNYRAIEMKNAYCVIVASNIMGNINVASLGGGDFSCTLINTPTYKWPLYSVDYYVRIGGVDYIVKTRTSDSVVVVHDSGATLTAPQTSITWEMWGYPKNEAMKLNNFDINYEYLGQQQKDFQGTTSTDGGQN